MAVLTSLDFVGTVTPLMWVFSGLGIFLRIASAFDFPVIIIIIEVCAYSWFVWT